MKPDLQLRGIGAFHDAGEFLAGRGIYGVAWLDETLKVVEKFGDLVSFIPIGIEVTHSVIALMGCDEQIKTLRRRGGRSFTVPNILLDPMDRNSLRINFAIYWLEDQKRYLLLVARSGSRRDIEYQLAVQVRGRLMAESEVAAKAKIIAKTNEELTHANRDLQEFAYVISHDLRAPLRALRYFARDAQTAVADGELETAAENIERVLEQTKRMAAMLNGLLEYSRVGSKDDSAETIDMGILVRDITGSIEHHPGIKILVEGDWPTIVTLVQPIDIVIRNLIDNAVKHHDRDTGRIHVRAADGATHSDGDRNMWLFTVVDDGPGIPLEWHSAVFEPFRKISGGEDGPEGSGIGLALVKKTVERFRGRIELSSDPTTGRGTVFRIFWPKAINLS